MVSKPIDKHLQQPINSNNDTDIFRWKVRSNQHHHHGDESCTGYAGSSYTSQGGSQTVNKVNSMYVIVQCSF